MNSPTAREAIKLNSILSDFTEASGMTLNLDKSKLFFFNTPVAVQLHISKILGIPRSSLPSNYLGIPLTGAPAKSISWDSLLLSISNRLANWTFRPLNIAARLVLLKSVLQTLPTYLFTALAAPKQIIRAVRNIQRNFLWQGLQPNKKWALVSWDKVCTPKSMGDLGLQDPGKLNQIMGAKIWWRWMKTPDALWAQIWKNKYAPSMQTDQLIRHNVRIQGSNIWNTAWQNKDIIQKHAFWEIRNGDSARFWQDSWQQLKPLNELAELTPLQQALNQAPSLKVKDLWKPLEARQTWRQWKTSSQDLGIPPDLNLSAWHYEAGRRKIPIKEGPDILRWGHSASGNFSVKEAYYLQGNYHNQEMDNIWSKIWNKALWPKVSTFLWLIIHNRILTWDNLRKRGFIGPSICVLCQCQEETKEHLFNGCHYSQSVWDQGAQIMRRSNQNRGSIRDTIENWDSITYNNPILNYIWQLLPGFILWQIWKERNKRIFHSKESTPELTWDRAAILIKETIRSKNWQPGDKECNREELCTLQSWQLKLNDSVAIRAPKNRIPSPTTWTLPPTGFIKINFDGASKGNPGPAGYGAVIRSSKGEILTLTAGYLGETTNNVAELTGLLQGLRTAATLPSHKIILEGDSQIIIQLITKILHGGNPQKISPSWRLAGMLEDFKGILRDNISIIPSHVKRGQTEWLITWKTKESTGKLNKYSGTLEALKPQTYPNNANSWPARISHPRMGCHAERKGHVEARRERPFMVANRPHTIASYEGSHLRRPPSIDGASHAREQAGQPEH
jgi:ribonuclease HI